MSGWNGSGTFDRVHDWTSDEAANIDPSASRFDAEDDNFAQGITNCLTKDGQNSPTTNLPMGGYKHTNVANGSARNQYPSIGQIQDGSVIYAAESGAADAYVISPSPAITAYAAGQAFRFIATNANTGASTLAVSGLAAKDIKVNGNSDDPTAGDIPANGLITAVYDGTVFQITTGQGAAEINGKAAIISSPTTDGIVTQTASGDIQDSGAVISTDGTLASDSDANIPTEQAVKEYADSPAVSGFSQHLYYVEERQASGSDSAVSPVATTWVTRDLNTEVIASFSGASLSSRTITLPAGTYIAEAGAFGYALQHHALRLHNVTDNTQLILGMASYAQISSSGANVMDKASLFGSFTLASSKDVELQHISNLAPTTGFGFDIGVSLSTSHEVYAFLKIWKIAD